MTCDNCEGDGWVDCHYCGGFPPCQRCGNTGRETCSACGGDLVMIHCARPACNNYTDLPDGDWIAIVPAAEAAIVNRATFCCARCAVLWLENRYMTGVPL